MILAAACLLAAPIVATSAHAAAELKVSAGSGSPGSSVPIPVSLASDTPVLALQFDLAYPPASLISDGAVLSDPASGLTLVSRETSPGHRRVIIYSPLSKPLPNGPLVSIPFNIASDAASGTAKLSLDTVILADAQFQQVASILETDGALTITSESASPGSPVSCSTQRACCIWS